MSEVLMGLIFRHRLGIRFWQLRLGLLFWMEQHPARCLDVPGRRYIFSGFLRAVRETYIRAGSGTVLVAACLSKMSI